MPSRSITVAAWFSTVSWLASTSALARRLPSEVVRSRLTLFLPRFRAVKRRDSSYWPRAIDSASHSVPRHQSG